ncbi:uncharacterized protein [Argopecten irradians]|uniref:uncharacterized protein n=1 Tax=Argopecten irradians TaxID=31199 RepID=UPI003713F3BF
MNQKKMAKTGQLYLSAKKMVLKKYRKQRFGVRKKCIPSLVNVLDPDNTEFKFKRQHVRRLQSRGPFSSSTRVEDETFTLSQLVTSSLSHTNVCSEFPISEIGSELSGNRGNGNSPFNSSNSCGSPESVVIQSSFISRCSKDQGRSAEDHKGSNMNDCDKCNPEHNNLGTENECECPRNTGASVKDMEESIIDVVSLDEEEDAADETDFVSQDDNASQAFDLEECLDKRKPLSVDVKITGQPSSSMPSLCKVSGQSSSRSSVSPVNWQQQFMSFLSTTPEPSYTEDVPCHVSSSKSPSHSSRKKRSRRSRSSMCPCCAGTSSHSVHGKRNKHHSGHSRKHSLSKEHKHFIRDMVQLVSLRNKVVTLFCSIFPRCREFIRLMNPDSEKVDLLIDQVVDIIQTPEPFDIDHHEEEKYDVKSVASNSDSGTDLVDLSEYPSLEKPDDVFFADKDSDDMPVLDDYSTDDKTQDEGEAVSKSYSEDFLKFLEKAKPNSDQQTKDFDEYELDPGGNSTIPLLSGPSNLCDKTDAKNCNITCSENGADIDIDVGAQSRASVDHCLKDCQLGLSTDLGGSYNSKCNNNSKTGSSELLKKTVENKTQELVGDKFQGSFKEFLNSNWNEDSISDHEMHDISCEGEDHESKLSLFTSINSHQPIHLPAYSDISEASQLSSSSPFDWPGGVDAHSAHQQVESQAMQPDKFCGDGLLDTAEDVPSESAGPNGANCGKDLPCDPLQSGVGKTKTIKLYESYVETCKKPKICLKALKHRLNALLTWLLPSANLGSAYFKNLDNLDYLLDVLIYCNTVKNDTTGI